MHVSRLRFILSPSPHWEAMRTFYQQCLGLHDTGGWDEPGDHGVYLEAPAADLELMEQDASALGIVPPSMGAWHLAVVVGDLEAALQRCLTYGARVDRGPTSRGWGGRDALIRDPAGNPVLLIQDPEREPAD